MQTKLSVWCKAASARQCTVCAARAGNTICALQTWQAGVVNKIGGKPLSNSCEGRLRLRRLVSEHWHCQAEPPGVRCTKTSIGRHYDANMGRVQASSRCTPCTRCASCSLLQQEPPSQCRCVRASGRTAAVGLPVKGVGVASMGLPPSSPRSPGSGASSRPARSTSDAEISSPSRDASLGGFERHSASSCCAERCKNSRYPASRACCCPKCAASSFRTTALLRCCKKCAAHTHISAGQSLQAEMRCSLPASTGPIGHTQPTKLQ